MRGFTSRELMLASSMRRNGVRWHTIARTLGRRSAGGIRRRLDAQFRIDMNQYMRVWKRFQAEKHNA